MSTVLSDRYRCAADSLEIGSAEALSSEPGYFRFDTAVCFGRLAFGTPSPVTSPELIDARAGVRHLDGRVCLPFDLSEVVTNLRQERYALASTGHLQRIAESKMARDLYRYIRPALPTGVRKHLQRAGLNGWNRIPFPQWPVDVTVETLLEQALMLSLQASGRNRIPFVWFWPEGARACAMMTHDVESREGRDFCDQLMDLDEAHGMPASFQVVPEARYDVPERFLTSLRRRGFEVNVHDLDHDGRLFDSRTEFVRRAARINDYAKAFGSRGFRAGVMYRNQEWFDHLDVSYDMSVPNVAHLEPQRGGCCTVFPYFVGKILELPLTTTQDYSLFHILGDYTTSLWQKQAELILGRHGLMSFIAHPDYLVEARARRVYVDLLSYLDRLRHERGVWIALPSDVDRWWRNRSQMELVQSGDRWHVRGPESERACVAFASLRGDRIAYEIQAQPIH